MATQDRTSAIAQHLRHYYRTPQINTEAPFSYSLSETTDSVHSTRHHWAKKRLRSRFKDLVLKVLAESASREKARKTTPKRPPLMRMKDSDDYVRMAQGMKPQSSGPSADGYTQAHRPSSKSVDWCRLAKHWQPLAAHA